MCIRDSVYHLQRIYDPLFSLVLAWAYDRCFRLSPEHLWWCAALKLQNHLKIYLILAYVQTLRRLTPNLICGHQYLTPACFLVEFVAFLGSQNDEKVKVLRMSLPIVESLSGLQESIFSLFRGLQLNSREKSKNWSNFIKFTDFPPFPLFGVPWAAVIT